MGHYPIKCVHCMKTVPMDERLVKLVPQNIVPFDFGVENYRDEESGFLIDLESDSRKRESIWCNIQGLKDRAKVEYNEINITVSNEFFNKNPKEYNKNLIQSIDVHGLKINGETLSGKIRKFYCPHCYAELHPLSGHMPIYLVSMMGSTRAGKTVYLTILQTLLSGKRYRLPDGILSFESIGTMAKVIQGYALDLKRNGKLPGTTTENRKDPYLLKVSYTENRYSSTIHKQCLLGLIDMRGETFNDERNDLLSNIHTPQFAKSDGFLMFVDPSSLEKVYMSLPLHELGGMKIELLDLILTNMRDAIYSAVLSELGTIDKPSVVALTKLDILYKYHRQLGIPLTQPVIAPQFRKVQGANLYQTYYMPMSWSTRKCIEHLSGGFTMFLSTVFKNPYYMSLSALGTMVKINGAKVDDSSKIYPVRIEEPLIHLLMDFHFIPPFYSDDYFTKRGDTLEEWAVNYAENKEDLAL